MDERLKKIISGFESLCARREYCSQDILTRIMKKTEGDVNDAGIVLEYLVENNFVNDLRYASAFAREKSSINGWGPAKIRFALSGKRIPADIITEALGEIEQQKADARLVRLLENKWASLAGDPQGRFKLLKFALSRGYGYDQVREHVARITSCRASDDI